MKGFCPTHPTSETYMDPDTDKMKCWDCYYADEFYNPRGKDAKIWQSFPLNNFLLRMVVRSTKLVTIELWLVDGENHKRIDIREYGFMSQAQRSWIVYIRRLENNGKLNSLGD